MTVPIRAVRWLETSRTIQWDYWNIVKRNGKMERALQRLGVRAAAGRHPSCRWRPASAL